MYDGLKLTMTADVDNDNSDETGVFEIKRNARFELGVQTLDLIGPRGQQAAALIDKTGLVDVDGAGGFSLAGGEIETISVDFQDFGGSSDRWGDGSADDAADAEGEGPKRQLSVLHRYLSVGDYDSTNPITVEIFEYDGTTYPTIDAKLAGDPSQSFDVDRQTSVHDGQLTFRRIGDVENILSGASGQQNNK